MQSAPKCPERDGPGNVFGQAGIAGFGLRELLGEQPAAAKLGIEPIALADRVVSRYEALWERVAISHDDFIRTTEARHRQGVDRLIEKMTAAGDVYLGSYDGMYCAGCEAFYPESQIVDGKCPDQGHPVEAVREASYFFRLSNYQAPLLAWLDANPGIPALRRMVIENLAGVERALQAQHRDLD